MSRRLTALLAIGLLGCHRAPATPATTSRSQDLNQQELPFLQASTAGVRRSGDSLLLPLAGGGAMALVDDTTEGESSIRYVYRGPLAGTGFLAVDVGLWEGGTYLLVDPTTGRKTFIDDLPVPSPSGRLLAVASMDMEAGYEPTRLTIYSVVADSLVQLWRVDSIPWGPESVAWRGEDSLSVTQAFPTDSGPGIYSYRNTWVVRRSDAWHLDQPRQ